jgi:3-dehydrosphinganine reductase
MFPSDTDTPQLAYENEFKPPETKALGNFGGSMSAEDVAKVALKGIEGGKYYIFPNFESKFYIRLSELARGVFDFLEDQIILGAYKKKNSSQSKEA